MPDWLRRWVMPAWCAFERLGSWAVGHGEVAGAARRGELVGKACCAARARLPRLLCRRRTVRGVAAYFDLITEDGRLFFGDSFHFGFFPDGAQSLAQALDAHTDLVCELAGIRPGMRVLDVGCGIGEPARRIASRIDCEIIGLNISREQVRQGRELIARAGLAARVDIRHGNALHMPLPDGGFGAMICLEAARRRYLRAHGGQTAADRGTAPDAAPRRAGRFQRSGVRPAADRGRGPGATRSAVPLGPELLTDWPGLFAAAGFQLGTVRDIQAQTLPTWQHVQAVYRQHVAQIRVRYGRRLGLVSPAISTARSPRSPLRSDAAAATRR